jgi:putative methyltransferase (TIGR04325 family)
MFRKLIKFILPVFIINIINVILKRNIIIIGNYSSWEKALENSTGYNDDKIFQKLNDSFLKILDGKAQYERDSVLFFNKKLNLPLISLMEKVRKKKKNRSLKVLDFGGSFGSTYFQNREYFSDSTKYIWDVVEQKKIVNFAKKKLKIKNLFFYESLPRYIKKNKPDIVLFSGVLQYLESPFLLLSSLKKKNVNRFVILKTPFFKNKSEIKIQINPSYIYKANYPIRVFNEHLFKSFFRKWNYKVDKLNWDNQLIDDIDFKSFLITRINN